MANYSDTIRHWATDDRRAGILTDADGTGEVGLAAGESGTRLAVRFTLRVRGDHVETVRYQVFGCGFTIAACAAAAELAEGHALKEVAAIDPRAVDVVLAGLPEERAYCAELAVEALQAAVKSAGAGAGAVAAVVADGTDHAPLVSTSDPVYRLLISSPAPTGAPEADRRMFAGLLAVAVSESPSVAANIGLAEDELQDLLDRYFPVIRPIDLIEIAQPSAVLPPCAAPVISSMLLDYLPADDGQTPVTSLWLARIVATRAARPGHLWRSMGFFARPELTAAIHRHLPALAAANSQGMRWKRFLYKQLCEQTGGVMCRTPDCGECSEYSVCFDR